MIAAALIAVCLARSDVRDLPLIEAKAKQERTTPRRIAIMLTGDGGWRRIDVRVTNRFRDEGIDVVGFLTPDFFEKRKTPEESACALERVIRHYQTKWNADRVILVGYSRGADVLPFMASRLPPDVRSSIDVIALLGLQSTIDFKYHRSWIPFYHPHEKQFPVRPGVEKLRGEKIVCVYGEKERDTLCPTLEPSLAESVRVKGSHHFAGGYADIADTILAATKPH